MAETRPEPQVEALSFLKIIYEIIYEGRVLERSEPAFPIEYQLGQGYWPAKIESQLLGAIAGAECLIEVSAGEHLFGELDIERIIQMDSQDFDNEPEPGDLIEFDLPDSQQVEGQVISVFGDKIEVDFNHPYAGRDLLFKIQIQAIVHP